MLTKVRILDSRGETLELPMDVLEENTPYAIKDIEGLGPTTAIFATSPFALLDGEQYLSHRGEVRNVVMTIGFSPQYAGDETVQTLRQRLYEFAMPGEVVELRFVTDSLEEVRISGRVESNLPAIFSTDPENQISILCMRPTAFQALEPTVVTGRVNVGFEIDYLGSKNIGFEIEIHVDDSTTGLVVSRQNFPVENLIYENLLSPLQSGDVVSMSTIRGAKYAKMNRFGATNSILGDLLTPEWPELRRGRNQMLISSGLSNATFKLTYTTMYGGL